MEPEKPGKLAKEIAIELEDEGILKVFLLKGNYYVSDTEGLKIVNAASDWLTYLQDTTRTLRYLRFFGFTGKTETVIYQNELGYFTAQVRPFKEWASIWTLFATRRNTKAAKLLYLLAIQGISDRIASVG